MDIIVAKDEAYHYSWLLNQGYAVLGASPGKEPLTTLAVTITLVKCPSNTRLAR